MTPPNRETTPPTPNAGEWITHDGGTNPVPGQEVVIQCRGGHTVDGYSDMFTWEHDCHPGYAGDIIAYRLATPSPAAQDDPAKGLEVVGTEITHPHRPEQTVVERAYLAKGIKQWGLEAALVGSLTTSALAQPKQGSFAGYLWAVAEVVKTLLTDHATATRQIAELRAAYERMDAAAVEYLDRALAAEADAATVREAAEYGRNVAGQMIDMLRASDMNVFADFLTEFINRADAALTQRGA